MEPTMMVGLAFQIGSQLLRAVADFQDRAAAGKVTEEELRQMADKVGINADELIAEAKAKKIKKSG